MSVVADEAAAPPGLRMPSASGGRSGFLADVIVELELAGRDEVDRATAEARLKGRTLAEVLVGGGTLGERDLAQAVAERHGLPMIDLDSFPVDPEAAQLVGRATARRYGVAPAGFSPDGALMLAMADPCDSLARNDVAVMTKLEVKPVIAARGQIDALVEGLPESGALVPAAPADQEEREPAAKSGSLLWQSEEPAADPGADRASGMFAVRTADRSAEHEARAHRLQSELAEQKGCAADFELDLLAVRTELEELRGRYERKRADLEGRVSQLLEELGERDSQTARLEGEVAYRDGRLGELERQLADRDSALAELEAELAAARRGER